MTVDRFPPTDEPATVRAGYPLQPDAMVGYELVAGGFGTPERVIWQGQLPAWRARPPSPADPEEQERAS